MKNSLSRVPLKDTIKVVMPSDVLLKIQQLCRIISTVEWSGILLYETTGSIQDPKNMVITLKDIILMNKGSHSYTEYSFTEKKRDQSGYEDRHIDYCEEFEEALTWQIGHVHSHQDMSVFFSGTDMEELEDNSPSHNFYLSLIVNNKMDFMAKVSFIATAEMKEAVSYTALDENGNEYTIEKSVLKAKKEKLFIYDCAIESDLDNIPEETFFERNLKEVLSKTSTPVNTGFNGFQSRGTGSNNFQNNTTTFNKPATPAKFTSKPEPIVNPSYYEYDPFEVEQDLYDSLLEAFAKDLLSTVAQPDDELEIEDLLLTIKQSKLNGLQVSTIIMEHIFEIYESYFGDTEESDFEEVIELTVCIFEDYEAKYAFLSTIITSLKKLIKEYLKTNKDASRRTIQ